MDEIAQAAGTSKSIVYRYFHDKAGLRRAVASAVVADMHDALARAARQAPTPLAAMRAMVGVYLEMIEHSPQVYWFVARASIAGPDPEAVDDKARSTETEETPLSSYLDSVIELVAGPFAQAAGVSPHDAAAWAAGAVGFVRGTGEWWLAHRGLAALPDRDALAEQITLWLWDGPVGVLHSHAAAPTS